MSDDVARLGYEIDSSQAAQAAANLAKMSVAADKSARAMSVSMRAGAQQSRTLDQVVRAAQASQRQIERLAQAQARGQITGAQFTGEINKLAAGLRSMGMDKAQSQVMQYARAASESARSQSELSRAVTASSAVMGTQSAAMDSAASSMARYDRGVRSLNANTTNLVFQGQDIAMMTAAMQNPLMLAMQQGTQVAGIFQQIRDRGEAIGPAVASSFTKLINPMTFVTLAVIAGGAALAQWGISALQAGRETRTLDDIISDLTDRMGDLDGAMDGANEGFSSLINIGGRYTQSAERIAKVNREIALMDAAGALRDTIDAVSDLSGFDNFRRALDNLNAERERLATVTGGDEQAIQRQLQGTIDFVNLMAGRMGVSVESATALVRALEELETAGGPEDQADAARRLSESFIEAVGGIDKMNAEQQEFIRNLALTEQAALRLQVAEERRTAAIVETERELGRQITLLGMIKQFGEESIEVQNMRNSIAQDEFEARLRSQGIIGDELNSLVQLFITQQDLSDEAERTADAIALITSADIGSFEAQVRALAEELGIAADEARRLLNNMPVGTTYGDRNALAGLAGGQLIFGGMEGDIREPRGGSSRGAGSIGEGPLTALERLLGPMSNDPYAEATQWYNEALTALADAQLLERGMLEQHSEYRLQIEQAYSDQLTAIRMQERSIALNETSSMFSALASVTQAGGQRLTKITATFAAAATMIKAYETAQKAAAEAVTIPGRIAAYATFLAQGLQSVQAIRNAGASVGAAPSGASAGAASAALPTATPERIIRVDFDGPNWARDMFQSFQDQLYENSRDGTRVIFAR